MIEIYTDGAYNPVRQQGGWAAIVIEDGRQQVYSGTAVPTTSNRMEITAALEGLQKTPADAQVTVYTDSQYLFGSMTRNWQRRANRDLWEQMDKTVRQRKVRWEWIDQNVINPCQKEVHRIATGCATQTETEAKPASPVAASLTHIDSSGKPKMVDVTAKPDTEREAVAKCLVRMKPETYRLIMQGQIAKGDVLTVAQLAGIMGSKHTPYLIPLCHPLLISDARVEFAPEEAAGTIEITATVKTTGKTGVEMEALTAAVVSALTVYDMCKAVDRGMKIDNLRLVRKSGGKSGNIVLE